MKAKYIHLHEHQQMLWCRVASQEGLPYPNSSMLLDIMLVMQGSSAVVEQGFSTLWRNLRENRLSMSNERLNQILTVKTNLHALRNLIKDCDDVIIKECIEKYYEKKKWRWSTRNNYKPHNDQCEANIYGPSPTKKGRIGLTNYYVEVVDKTDDEEADKLSVIESEEDQLTIQLMHSHSDSLRRYFVCSSY